MKIVTSEDYEEAREKIDLRLTKEGVPRNSEYHERAQKHGS